MQRATWTWAIDHIAASLSGRSGTGLNPARRRDDDPSPNLSSYHIGLLVSHSPPVTRVAHDFIRRALRALQRTGALLDANPDAMAHELLSVEVVGLRSGRRSVTKSDFLIAYRARDRPRALAALICGSLVNAIWRDAKSAATAAGGADDAEEAGGNPADG